MAWGTISAHFSHTKTLSAETQVNYPVRYISPQFPLVCLFETLRKFQQYFTQWHHHTKKLYVVIRVHAHIHAKHNERNRHWPTLCWQCRWRLIQSTSYPKSLNLVAIPLGLMLCAIMGQGWRSYVPMLGLPQRTNRTLKAGLLMAADRLKNSRVPPCLRKPLPRTVKPRETIFIYTKRRKTTAFLTDHFRPQC